MSDVFVLLHRWVDHVRDAEDSDDEWRYAGVEVRDDSIAGLHRRETPWQELSNGLEYASTPFVKFMGEPRMRFSLPEGVGHGYVVYLRHSDYHTFGGTENVLDILDVFEYQEDAQAFTEAVRRHFGGEGPSSWTFEWGPKTYTFYHDYVSDVGYEKLDLE